LNQLEFSELPARVHRAKRAMIIALIEFFSLWEIWRAAAFAPKLGRTSALNVNCVFQFD
jgi:hypothetical protein